jgi:hypothetical protein
MKNKIKNEEFSHTKIGTCIDIGKMDHRLTQIGDATDWQRLTDECKSIKRQQFIKHTGDKCLASKAINFGRHPKYDFIWVEVPHKDKIGTVHHYYFVN